MLKIGHVYKVIHNSFKLDKVKLKPTTTRENQESILIGIGESFLVVDAKNSSFVPEYSVYRVFYNNKIYKLVYNVKDEHNKFELVI